MLDNFVLGTIQLHHVLHRSARGNRSVISSKMCKLHLVVICKREFHINLLVICTQEFDVILGMD